MPDEDRGAVAGPGHRATAFGVHVFTALGAGLGLLALLAAVEKRWAVMFGWLALALVIDACDGTLARRFAVRTTVPRWSGDTLDLVVDILTWVFVPAYAVIAAGLLPPALAVPLGAAIVITSVIYFADTKMKGPENYFYGFPGAWNVVAFFMFLLGLDPWINAALVVALCVLTFVRVPFVHPFRVVQGRALNWVLLAAGAALAVVALLRNLEPGPFVTAPLCIIGLYFLGVGLLNRATKA
jgi:phosphatidylcholine synthase